MLETAKQRQDQLEQVTAQLEKGLTEFTPLRIAGQEDYYGTIKADLDHANQGRLLTQRLQTLFGSDQTAYANLE